MGWALYPGGMNGLLQSVGDIISPVGVQEVAPRLYLPRGGGFGVYLAGALGPGRWVEQLPRRVYTLDEAGPTPRPTALTTAACVWP